MPLTDTQFDDAVTALLDLPERAFDERVVAYVMDRDRTVEDEDLFRDPAVVERTSEAVLRVLARVEASLAADPERTRLRPMRTRLQQERSATRPLAGVAREQRRREEQAPSPRARAMRRLAAEPDLRERFLALVREEREREAVPQ